MAAKLPGNWPAGAEESRDSRRAGNHICRIPQTGHFSRRGKPRGFRGRTVCRAPNGNRHVRSKSASRSFRNIWRKLWTVVPADCFDAPPQARYMLLWSLAQVSGGRRWAGSMEHGAGSRNPRIPRPCDLHSEDPACVQRSTKGVSAVRREHSVLSR